MNPRNLLFLVVLSTTACASSRRTTSMQTDLVADSARLVSAEVRLDELLRRRATTNLQRTDRVIRRWERTEPIPAQRATLRVTEQNLRDLPDGAVFTACDGRLTIEARRYGDTIRLQARCDSLARRSLFYEETAEQSFARSDSLQEQLSTLREAYRALEHSMMQRYVQTTEQRSRSPSRWGWWLTLGLVAGTVGGWWAHKTGFIQKLIKTLLQ